MGFSISKEATWPSDNHKYYNNQYNNNYHDDYNYDGDNYHDKVSIMAIRVVEFSNGGYKIRKVFV